MMHILSESSEMNTSLCLNRLLEVIYQRSPLQKRKLRDLIEKSGPDYLADAERFASDYIGYLEHEGIPIEDAVEAYLSVCSMMMKYHIQFLKTGKYPLDTAESIYDNVYNDEKAMKSYMIGAAISQILWETHFRMFKGFRVKLQQYAPKIKSYLEIGCGHGLYLNQALEYLPKSTSVDVVDISKISIGITKSILDYFRPNEKRVNFREANVLELNIENQFDFIEMGEVLEHVYEPEKLLKKISQLLSNDGRAFISTCVNCPAQDHVCQFDAVQQIRDMFNRCGLVIESEEVLPVEDLPMEEVVRRKVTINYYAITTKG